MTREQQQPPPTDHVPRILRIYTATAIYLAVTTTLTLLLLITDAAAIPTSVCP